MKTIFVVLGILMAAGLPSVQQGDLAPDVWVHEGDSDGDGFSLGEEYLRGYDPRLFDEIQEAGISRRRSWARWSLRPITKRAMARASCAGSSRMHC